MRPGTIAEYFACLAFVIPKTRPNTITARCCRRRRHLDYTTNVNTMRHIKIALRAAFTLVFPVLFIHTSPHTHTRHPKGATNSLRENEQMHAGVLATR